MLKGGNAQIDIARCVITVVIVEMQLLHESSAKLKEKMTEKAKCRCFQNLGLNKASECKRIIINEQAYILAIKGDMFNLALNTSDQS